MLNTLAKINEYCLNEKLYTKFKYLKKNINFKNKYIFYEQQIVNN